ncbi:MAG: CoA transferase, partial [Gammaproteobacteria bacterium]
MKPLQDLVVAVVAMPSGRALLRFFETFGARLVPPPQDDAGWKNIAFLVDGIGLPALERAGYTRARLEHLNPRLVHVSVSSFGSYGPTATWHGGELVASAMSGTLRLTGEPDRPPVKEALDACTFHADMVAVAGAMSAHFERERGGSGQHVDVSIQEVALNRNVSSILVWQFERRKLQRVGGALNYGRATVRCIWPLADGWCFHSLMTGRFGAPANQALSDW